MEEVGTIASCLASLSLFVLIWQVKANHDRCRREKAIELIFRFDDVQNSDTFKHIGLLFSLGAADVESIWRGHEITINSEQCSSYLPELEPGNDNTVIISVDLVITIRRTMVSVLNSIEAIAIAYKHHAADRLMLRDAFENQFIKKGFIRRCGDFIEHFGDDAWPTIKELPVLMVETETRRKPA